MTYWGRLTAGEIFYQIKYRRFLDTRQRILPNIWIISKNHTFNWQEIIEEAKTKEEGVDPVAIYEILNSFPVEVLKTVKWLKLIADDILKGSNNSLY